MLNFKALPVALPGEVNKLMTTVAGIALMGATTACTGPWLSTTDELRSVSVNGIAVAMKDQYLANLLLL